MSTSPLFHALIDDAALFPPGNAAMPDAVPAHREHHAAWYAPLVGPFLCPASRLDELAAVLDADVAGEPYANPATAHDFAAPPAGGPLGVTVVVDTGTGGIAAAVDAVAADHRMVLRGVEVPLRGEPLSDAARRVTITLDAAIGGPDDDEPAYVEIPRASGWRAALDVVAEAGYRAKLRTGGVTPDAFPAEPEVADFILACLETDVPFKCTAGLHRAVRHTAADGAQQHGFLNLLLAVADALDGADADAIAARLAEREGPALAEAVGGLPLGRAAKVRAWLGSYGSCSISEPLDDLLDLGLISKE